MDLDNGQQIMQKYLIKNIQVVNEGKIHSSRCIDKKWTD